MATSSEKRRETDSISIFDLSPELRNEIYGYATVINKTVAIRSVSTRLHHYEFIVCPDDARFRFEGVFSNAHPLRQGCKLLDGALMLSCKAIRNEALAVLPSMNHIVLAVSSYFSDFYSRLRTVTFVADIGLSNISPRILDELRHFSRHATMLTELSIWLFGHASAVDLMSKKSKC